MKFLIKISLLSFLMFGAFACTKETESQPSTEPATTEETVEIELEATDRANDAVTFSFQAGDAVDLQYTLTNLTTGVSQTKTWISFWKSNVTFYVPQENCVKASFKVRRVYHVTPLTWSFKRGTCPALTGATSVTAPYNTPWSAIPAVIITASQCHCN